jgi:hypothetical protein
MDELTALRDGWGAPEPPTGSAYTMARTGLMREISGGTKPAPHRARRRWRVGLVWLTSGTAVTAAAAAAVVLALSAQTSDPTRLPTQLGAGTGTGQQILLAAAKTAESQPAGKGAYWHISQTMLDRVNNKVAPQETWTAPDGTGFMRTGNGTVTAIVPDGFQVGLEKLTFAQVQQLPTDPAKLTDWMTRSFTKPSTGTSADEIQGEVAFALIRVLWDAPAPPAVRAAAFRAFAAMSNVTNLGNRDGGTVLKIAVSPPPADKFAGGKLPAGADSLTIVIDTTTTAVLSVTNYQGTDKIDAGWTTNVPKVTQPLPTGSTKTTGKPAATPIG